MRRRCARMSIAQAVRLSKQLMGYERSLFSAMLALVLCAAQ